MPLGCERGIKMDYHLEKPINKTLFSSIIKSVRKDYQLWLMVLPAIIITFIFKYIPMYGIQLAFREFDYTKGLTGGAFVGLKYFKKFFESSMFGPLLRNTINISTTTVMVGFVAPIALALIVNQIGNKRTKQMMQTTVYLPHFISIVVMVGLLNVFLSPEKGAVTHLLSSIGFTNTNLLGSAKAFVPVYVISEVWQHCGWNSIIYLAALSNVDPQLYESARMDGASRWQLVRYVDIPSLIPTMVVLFIMNMGGILNAGFEKIFLMQNTLNLPVSEVISTYTYKIGILSSQFSYSTAIGLFNTLINFFFLITANFLSKKFTKTSLW